MQFKKIIFLISLLILFITINAQNSVQLSADEVDAYSKQSEQIIKYFEGTLNFLGDPNEVASEKDIIINESYLKIFVDDQMQIEDDLDENREIPISKDVQAYLKDVNFFYKEVSFTFVVNSIENFVNDNGQIYFKASVNRNLKGITITDDTIDNNQIRYFEINLNAIDKDLKIASIYTSLPNKKYEMAFWWNNMPDSWKDYFGQGILIYDTLPFSNIISFDDSTLVTYKWFENILADTFLINETDTLLYSNINDSLATDMEIFIKYDTLNEKLPDTIKVGPAPIYSQIKKFRNLKNIDISNSILIGNIQPLSVLSNLEDVNISNTLIDDLNPLRNLNKLEILNCSGTPLTNLEALRYVSSLEEINLSSTPLNDISLISNLTNLEEANLSNTKVSDFTKLGLLKNLRVLNISGLDITENSGLDSLSELTNLIASNSKIIDLNVIGKLSSLQNLNVDSTNISNLEDLSGLEQLSVLQANNSKISDLSPLLELPELKLVYCDNSMVSKQEAQSFIDKKPDCMVIYNTAELAGWWNNLSAEWHKIAYAGMELSNPITKEQLHQIISVKNVDQSNNTKISDLSPLRMLYHLETLNVEGCSIESIEPLKSLKSLNTLNINNTNVSSLQPLSNISNLQEIRCENTSVENLLPLTSNENLKLIYADNSKIEQSNVLEFKTKLPECLVVYQTQKLQMWWDNLNSNWQEIFVEMAQIEIEPGREQLQEIIDFRRIEINNLLSINNLEELSLFSLLEEIKISNTSVTDISAITFLPSVKILTIPNNPVYDISSIARMEKLEELNIENTSVDDLEAIGQLKNLKVLNIAGTKIKNLKEIKNLSNLETLVINNTDVKSLKDIEDMQNLKELRCYNTKIKSSKIEDFKASHPDCEVVYY